jgi:hypothetical protein
MEFDTHLFATGNEPLEVGVLPDAVLEHDLAGLITAVAAAILAFAGVRLAERRVRQDARLSPQVGAIVARGHGGAQGA